MLHFKTYRDDGPLVLSIHWLSGSSRSWEEVCEGVSSHGMRCVAVDLPGFGDAIEADDFSISAMTCALIETIRSLRKNDAGNPWFLVGHSMGGKLATIVARAAEDGAEGLEHLRGMVLLSPSPPGPEPMKESKRSETMQAFGKKDLDAAKHRVRAEKFVDDNTGKLPLMDAVRARTIEDVLRMNPDALTAWLNTGSREDWSAHVGFLTTPALLLAGTEEEALGPEAQKLLTLPHLQSATAVSLEGGGHLAPLERPAEVVDRMLEFFQGLGVKSGLNDSMLGVKFQVLIDSNRTSSQTRRVLTDRMKDTPVQDGGLLPEERRTLRAVTARVIPDASFDLSARIEEELMQGSGDGWRFAALPEDVEAWKRGLFSLDAAAKREFGVPLIALDTERQDRLLKRAREGDLGAGVLAAVHLGDSAGAFDASQMRDWFEDVRGALVRIYVSDPRTMERIGFTGFADEDGFTQIRLAEREEFES